MKCLNGGEEWRVAAAAGGVEDWDWDVWKYGSWYNYGCILAPQIKFRTKIWCVIFMHMDGVCVCVCASSVGERLRHRSWAGRGGGGLMEESHCGAIERALSLYVYALVWSVTCVADEIFSGMVCWITICRQRNLCPLWLGLRNPPIWTWKKKHVSVLFLSAANEEYGQHSKAKRARARCGGSNSTIYPKS